MQTFAADLLRWIPLIPLLASILNIFFGDRWGRKNAGLLACAAVGGSFALSLYVVALLPAAGVFRDTVYTWIESGSFQAQFSLQVDALTAVMLMVVTGVGF
ncbi:MAG TPA: NADH-quinone oxidoreductase subunit L, partial [Candidatus Binatia bacterium]|nr:NADH-quinone oxidoreductase subunit L [Candidatus Binatia bacterium]